MKMVAKTIPTDLLKAIFNALFVQVRSQQQLHPHIVTTYTYTWHTIIERTNIQRRIFGSFYGQIQFHI